MIKIDLDMPAFERITEAIKGQTDKMKKLNKSTIMDMKQRMAPVVKSAVTAVYGIKPSEITKNSKVWADGKVRSSGTYTIKGVDVSSLRLVYKGRALTPRVFNMTPKSRPKANKKYKVKAEIYKGHIQALEDGDNNYDTPVFLAPNPQKRSVTLPFQRKEEQSWRNKKHTPITVIHRTSVPQMIENEKVNPVIKKRFEELLMDRLEHNAKRIANED